MLKTNLFILSIFISLLGGCLLGKGVKPVTQIEIHRVKAGVLDQFDSLDAHPLDEPLRQAAAEAQLALLKRLTGKSAETECGDMFRQYTDPIYVLADTTFTLPSGQPRTIRVQTSEELDSTAAKEGKDLLVLSMITLGSKEMNNARGIVVGFEYFGIDWEKARWNALSTEEKARLDMPEFRQIRFGGWCKFLVVREGTRLIFYDEPMTMS